MLLLVAILFYAMVIVAIMNQVVFGVVFYVLWFLESNGTTFLELLLEALAARLFKRRKTIFGAVCNGFKY